MTDNQTNPPASPAPNPRRYVPLVVAAFFASLLIGGGYFALRGALPQGMLGCCGTEEQELPPPPPQDDSDYSKWEKPLVAIVVSGQMHGYINPCGCSHPQDGGLERRYNFIDSLKAKGWDVVGIDLGEMAATKGIHEQNMLKYELSVKALRAMNYKAIGIGRDEILSPLGPLMAQIWDKNKPLPRPINMTLAQTAPGQLYHGLNVRPYEIIGDTNPKIGVINMMGPELCKELEAKEKFLANPDELPKALNAFATAGVEIGVILQHEYPKVNPNLGGIKAMQAIEEERKKQALACAKVCADARKKNAKIPAFQLTVLLIEDPEPPTFMTELDPKLPTQAIEIGHKGKYVGLVGVYRDKEGGYRLHYQKVKMSPEWATPDAKKATQPIIALMEKYHLELKSADMLAKAARPLHFNQIPALNQGGLAATYVGSNKCKSCHMEAFKIWARTDHAKATKTLEDEKHPSNRHYDPECMKCHTTGFQHPGGYNDLVVNLPAWPKAGKPDPDDRKDHNVKTRNVGCESCHGPASEHVKNPNNMQVRQLLNPYRPTAEERRLEDDLVKNPKDAASLQKWLKLSVNRRRAIESNNCVKCHDQENDVNWGNESKGKDIVARWLLNPERLIHHTPNNNGAGVAPPPAKEAALVPPPGLEPPLVIEVVPEKK